VCERVWSTRNKGFAVPDTDELRYVPQIVRSELAAVHVMGDYEAHFIAIS
jgi:hypothetical protein